MPPKGTSGVYRITNAVTGDCYIGSSSDVARRWKEHCQRLRRGTHDNSYLQRAWDKHGADSFAVALIEACDLTLLVIVEQRHMDVEKPVYNMTPVAGQGPGMAGRKHSEATLEKMRTRVFTEECREKMRAAHLNRWSPEERARQSISHMGKKRSPESVEKSRRGNMGHAVSEETRRKIGEANRAKVHQPHSEETRRKMSESHKATAATIRLTAYDS